MRNLVNKILSIILLVFVCNNIFAQENAKKVRVNLLCVMRRGI